MPVPVRIVKVLAGGALVEFTDGSTRLVLTETVSAWRRFGLAVNEGMMLNPDEVALYKRIVEEFPHYSGLPAEEVAQEETVPEVVTEVPEAAIVPQVTADSELREGHFGTGWLPDFGHNAQVLWQRELERARNKNKTEIEILDKEPDNVELEKLVTEIVEGRPVYGDTSYDWANYGIDPYKDSTPEALLAKELGISLYPGGVYKPLSTKELPVSIKKAQDIGSIFYKGSDGKKKLALYARQLADFELSASYMDGRGSINDQARRWLEAQIGAGNKIDFDNIGGAPKQILNKEWDDFIDDVIVPDADAAIRVDLTKSDFEPERTVEVVQAELDAINKERLDLGVELDLTDKERLALVRDLELGTSPGWQAPMPISRVGEVTEGGVGDFGDYSVRAPRVTDFQTDVTDTRMPVATGIPYGVPSDMDEGMGSYRFAEAPGVTSLDEGMEEGYMYASPGEAAVAGLIPRMTDTLPAGGVGDFSTVSNLPDDLKEALIKGEGVGDAFIKAQVEKAQAEALADVPWEERYPLAPQGPWRDEIDTSLAGLAWDRDIPSYYSIKPEDRDKMWKPPESDWDASRSGGSVWDRERRAAIEGRGMVDNFVEIQAEQDALDKISADRDAWWAQAHAAPDRYGDELGEYDQFVSRDGQLAGMQEGIPFGLPDPLQRVAETTGGEDAPINWKDQSPFLPSFDPRSGYGVGGDVQEFMYNGELWYLTKQGHYAKDYKRSELVRPWQTLPADFF